MTSCNQAGKVSEFCACLHLCLLSGCDRSGSLARVRVRHFLGRLGRQYVYRKKSPKATSNGTRWFRNCGCSPGFHETEQPISSHNRPKDQTAAGVHVHVQLLCVSLRFRLNVDKFHSQRESCGFCLWVWFLFYWRSWSHHSERRTAANDA